MLVLMEVVMMRVMQNRLRGRRTWIYFDELSVLFSYEWSTNFLDVSWKRYRKYGALASGIFQNLDQALDNEMCIRDRRYPAFGSGQRARWDLRLSAFQ